MGATLARGDVTERESMRAPMTGADCVIHNAGWYEVGVSGPAAEQKMQAINVDGAANALSLAFELGASRIVHVSSIVATGATGDQVRDESYTRQFSPPNVYERTKTEAHAIALDLSGRGAPIMIAMPGAVIGPGDHANLGILQRMYVRGHAPPLTVGGDYRLVQVYVDDCAEGIALIADKGRIGESYILASGNLSHREVYELWSTTPGGMKQRMVAPRWMATLTAPVFETVQRWFDLPNLLSRDAARGAYTNYDYSGAKAMAELGWQPGDLRQQWLDTLAEERRRAFTPSL